MAPGGTAYLGHRGEVGSAYIWIPVMFAKIYTTATDRFSENPISFGAKLIRVGRDASGPIANIPY